MAEAERQKRIALIEAEKEAERQATAIRLAATAKKDAASDRASAKLEEAQADADAIKVRAEAKKADLLATAEGQTAIANSENELSAEIIAMKIRLASLEAMPAMIAELVKPAEKIDSIKIHQVTGLNGRGASGDGAGGTPGTPVNQALDSVLGMALQMPAMQALGKELGVSLENGIGGVVDGVMGAEDAPAPEKPKRAEHAEVINYKRLHPRPSSRGRHCNQTARRRQTLGQSRRSSFCRIAVAARADVGPPGTGFQPVGFESNVMLFASLQPKTTATDPTRTAAIVWT